MEETHVVTCFLRDRGEVLLLRRSDAVGSYPGRWGGVAGHAEGAPDEQARREIAEETGLDHSVELVRAGEPFDLEDPDLDTRWVVHPYLFDCSSRAVETDEETVEFEWVHPTEILHRETVPDLWTSYARVAPTVDAVREDREHGSASLSVRALAVLRDRAGLLVAGPETVRDDRLAPTVTGFGGGADDTGDDWRVLADLAEALLAARPSMVVVRNRVHRAMAAASEDREDGAAAAVERAARAGIERAYAVDERAADAAAGYVEEATVLTLSRSGTVTDALLGGEPSAVLVAESRPVREGVGVAETLAAETDASVTLAVDAAVAHLLAERPVDCVLVGADAVLPDGTVVNKVGTRGTALAAAREDVLVYAVAASDKVSTEAEPRFEEGAPGEVYDGDATLDVRNPTFDATPPDCVAGVLTEDGPLSPDEVAAVAERHRERADWPREP